MRIQLLHLTVFGAFAVIDCFNCPKESNCTENIYDQLFVDNREQLETKCEYIKCINDFITRCPGVIKLPIYTGDEAFLKGFCIDGSDLQKKYLEISKCINVTSISSACPIPFDDPENITEAAIDCKKVVKTVDCVYRISKGECGEDATTVFQAILNPMVAKFRCNT